MEEQVLDSQEPQKTESVQDDHSWTPRITTLNIVSVVIAAALAVIAIILTAQLLAISNIHDDAYDRYNKCENAAIDLMIASDYLTTESRMHVITGDRSYMDGYLKELFIDKSREKAVDTLYDKANNEQAAARLNNALAESNELATTELYAMKLTALAVGTDPIPDVLDNVELKPEDARLSDSQMRDLAENLVLGDEYNKLKEGISADVDECAKQLVEGLDQNVRDIETRIERLMFALIVISVMFFCVVAFTAITNYTLVMRPMRAHARDIAEGKPLSIIGSREIKNVSTEYNKLYRETRRQTAELKRQAETDPLTGVLNRGSYDQVMAEGRKDIALVLADIDKFKEINDTYGHETGDDVLKRVAEIIKSHFRDSDYVCRIGGDEFAIILTRISPAHQNVIESKLESIQFDLARTSDDLPDVTLSFGVAFGENLKEGEALYHEADRALYASKKTGRNKASFYEGK